MTTGYVEMLHSELWQRQLSLVDNGENLAQCAENELLLETRDCLEQMIGTLHGLSGEALRWARLLSDEAEPDTYHLESLLSALDAAAESATLSHGTLVDHNACASGRTSSRFQQRSSHLASQLAEPPGSDYARAGLPRHLRGIVPIAGRTGAAACRIRRAGVRPWPVRCLPTPNGIARRGLLAVSDPGTAPCRRP